MPVHTRCVGEALTRLPAYPSYHTSVEPDPGTNRLLGEEMAPSRSRWYSICQEKLECPDLSVRIAVADRLRDAIIGDRGANFNSNGAGHLLNLYESILETQPKEVVAQAAQWAGLLAVRSKLYEVLTPKDTSKHRLVNDWLIQPWGYRTNQTRADKAIPLMEEHDAYDVRHNAQLSLNYWLPQPLTYIAPLPKPRRTARKR